MSLDIMPTVRQYFGDLVVEA